MNVGLFIVLKLSRFSVPMTRCVTNRHRQGEKSEQPVLPIMSKIGRYRLPNRNPADPSGNLTRTPKKLTLEGSFSYATLARLLLAYALSGTHVV